MGIGLAAPSEDGRTILVAAWIPTGLAVIAFAVGLWEKIRTTGSLTVGIVIIGFALVSFLGIPIQSIRSLVPNHNIAYAFLGMHYRLLCSSISSCPRRLGARLRRVART